MSVVLCGVETDASGVCPGTSKGRLNEVPVGGVPVEGTGGSSPRALSDAIRGFSATGVAAGWGVADGWIWGIIPATAGGGVDCWRFAVA